MMNGIALCKCGVDLLEHVYAREEEEEETELPEGYHWFDAAGTRHRCEKLVAVDGVDWLCPRPAYHQDEKVPCGPLTGEKLW